MQRNKQKHKQAKTIQFYVFSSTVLREEGETPSIKLSESCKKDLMAAQLCFVNNAPQTLLNGISVNSQLFFPLAHVGGETAGKTFRSAGPTLNLSGNRNVFKRDRFFQNKTKHFIIWRQFGNSPSALGHFSTSYFILKKAPELTDTSKWHSCCEATPVAAVSWCATVVTAVPRLETR